MKKQESKKPDNILRLKYRLEPKEDDIVEFEILEQDEKLRNLNPKKPKHYYTDKENDLIVSSEGGPEIMENYICLRGHVKSHDDVIEYFYGHDRIPSIHKALEEMVKKVYGNCTVVKG